MSARNRRRSPETLEVIRSAVFSEEFPREIMKIMAEGKDAKVTADSNGDVKINPLVIEGARRITKGIE